MDQELTKDVGQQISAYYKEIVTTLLHPANYSHNPKLDNVKAYLSFVEASLKKPFGRIVHIHSFLDLKAQLMTGRMYPFCYLLDAAKEKIKRLCCQTEWLMDGIESYDTKAAETLGIEPHEISDG